MIIIWSWNKSIYGEQNWQLASAKHRDDLLICRDLPVSDTNLNALTTLVNEHSVRGSVLVFLHRFHGYEQQHIEQINAGISQKNEPVYSFLFGEGSDPIYLTQNARGLLGIAGTFSAKVALGNHAPSMISAIADDAKKEIKPSHFNYVWQLYQFELHNRILELKEDLFSAFQNILPRTALAPGEAYQIISETKNRLLFLRLLSFTGRMRKGSNLAKELRSFEQKQGRRFSFEDCTIQLQQYYNGETTTAFSDLSTSIKQHLFGKTAGIELKMLRANFDLLVGYITEKSPDSL